MNFNKIIFVVSAITISLVFSKPQYGYYKSFNVNEIETGNVVHRVHLGQNYHNHQYQSIPLSNSFGSVNGYESDPIIGIVSVRVNPTQNNNNLQHQSNRPSKPYANIDIGNRNVRQSTSCDNYWSHNEKSGIISIPNPHYQKSKISVDLAFSPALSTNYDGDIGLEKDEQSTVNDILSGRPLSVKVRFSLNFPVPKLKAIYYNDQLICSESPVLGFSNTDIRLGATWIMGTTQQGPHDQETRRPEQTHHFTTPFPPSNFTNGKFDLDFECGVPDVQSTSRGLIIGGIPAQRGQFPWLAAYYYGEAGFICGGNLISTKLIVTAAHCVHQKGDAVKNRPEESRFYIGRHNLEATRGEVHSIVSDVSQLIIHPEWKTTGNNYDADIAIAVLSRTIEFTKYIKPICLWRATNDYQDLVGKSGVVAGWGITEFGKTSDVPKWTEIPVVTDSACLRSNYVFSQMTSERTFCAGDRSGTRGPCSGDSGGGFVVQNSGYWYLRGVISSSLHTGTLCDIKNYAVFTDVPKYNNWIDGYMNKYG